MVVKVEEIQAAGLELKEAISPTLLAEALEGSVGFRFKQSTPLSASFKKLSGRIYLKGQFDATVVAPCKRCLKEVELQVPVKFELNLVPEAAASGDDSEGDDDGKAERAGSFQLDQVDAEPFNGKEIDLDPIVREQVLLALPVSVVCKDDCRGLCTVCGQDLNERECGCERKVVDVRLAKLKDIKLN